MIVKKYALPKLEGETFQERKSRIVAAATFNNEKSYWDENGEVMIDGELSIGELIDPAFEMTAHPEQGV